MPKCIIDRSENKVAIESRVIYLLQITARFNTFLIDRCIMNISPLAVAIKYVYHLRLNIRERDSRSFRFAID